MMTFQHLFAHFHQRTRTDYSALVLLIFMLLATNLVGCSDQGDPVSLTPPDTTGNNGQFDWVDNIGPLLQTNCTSCHGATIQSGGFDARTFAAVFSYTTNAGNPLIDPGNPDGSELYMRVVGGLGFPQMPQGGTLSADEIAMIRQWIIDGAPLSTSEQASLKQPGTVHPVIQDRSLVYHP